MGHANSYQSIGTFPMLILFLVLSQMGNLLFGRSESISWLLSGDSMLLRKFYGT
jgi:hypothetical protein